MAEELRPLIEKVWRTCAAGTIRGRTVILKVKYADFTQITRSRSSSVPIANASEIERISGDLLRGLFPLRTAVRLLGVTLSSLADDEPARPRDQLDFGL